ncbi:hypothetical protein GCM10025792_47050 [Pseudonocardia tropica]
MNGIPDPVMVELADVPMSRIPGVLATDGVACQAAKFHSPTPLLLHPVVVDDREFLLCGVCRDQLAVLQLVGGTAAPWPVRRSFGNALRHLLESDHLN